MIVLSGLFVQVAHAADEIRLSTFPNVMLGTWAETAQQCAAKDRSRGNNYAVRALCTSASLPEKTQTVNIIVRTLAPDRAAMGRIYLRSAESVFDNLKTYLRCP
jgi:hypothetical protein